MGDVKSILLHLQTVFTAFKHPVPFMYQHLLGLINLIYLPLFAYTVAYNINDDDNVLSQHHVYDEVIGVLVVVFMGIFVLGLRQLGAMMAGKALVLY